MTLTAVLGASDGFTTRAVGRPIALQQLKAGEWWTIQLAQTDGLSTWSYTWTPEPGATYRLVASQVPTSAFDCGRTLSETLTLG